MLRSIEAKLYPTPAQVETLDNWLQTCCRVYNQALEQRIKAYKRRKESVSLYDQFGMLTEWRERISTVDAVPAQFARDALRRLDKGFKAFFRRLKSGQKPGFPRFRAKDRYTTLECLVSGSYIRPGNLLRIPKLGLVSFRAGNQQIPGTQKLLRIIKRASGWFAQVLVDDGQPVPPKVPVQTSIGVDVGLTTFAALSTGEKISNPRFARKSQRKVRSASRNLSRKQKRSKNRRKALIKLQRAHEKIKAQRKSFAHQHSRDLVNRFDLIAVEKLNIAGLARGKLSKSILDAAWGMFLFQLTYKAECAGRQVIQVNPRGTSQTCPNCGAIKKKNLSERVHECPCGLTCDRDQAAARVILLRALGVAGVLPAEGVTNTVGTVPAASRP